MKLIKRINEGESLDSAFIGWKIRKYVDAKSLKISIYFKIINFQFEIAVPNGKKREIL